MSRLALPIAFWTAFAFACGSITPRADFVLDVAVSCPGAQNIPAGAMVTVRLFDQFTPDSGEMSSASLVTDGSQPPYHVALRYDPVSVQKQNRAPALTAQIDVEGKTWCRTDPPYELTAERRHGRAVELVLKSVAAR